MADQALEELPRFPQDGSIRMAIEAKNFKKAVQLIDKRLKNSDKSSEYLAALKTLIMSRMPFLADNSFVLIRIEEVLEEASTITDFNIVDIYDIAFQEVLPESYDAWASSIGELRWRFVKGNPKDEDACVECFKACFLKDDIDRAIKIATSLGKTFPKKHEYVFWQITSMVLYAKSTKYPEKQRDLWGRLALGQVQKLAEVTIEAGMAGNTLPVKSIQTPQELLLLHLIEDARGETQHRLGHLEDPYLGPESTIAKGEWLLWIDRLDLLKRLERWQDLFELTSDLLRRARTKSSDGQLNESRFSDWIVWDNFRISAKKLNQKGKVFAELEAHLNPDSGIDKPWRRNAAIIWLDFTSDSIQDFSTSYLTKRADEGPTPELTQSVGRPTIIVEYLQKYGNTSVAYEDVRPHVQNLEPEERSELLEALLRNAFIDTDGAEGGLSEPNKIFLSPQNQVFDSADNITRLVNTYKIIYLLTSSILESERVASMVAPCACIICSTPCSSYCGICLTALALGTLKSYGTAIANETNIKTTLLSTDRHPADDLCILSAMCLIKLAVSTEMNSGTLNGTSAGHWLRASIILEYGWSQSKSNFQISLLLVRMYSHIGCGSLAMRAYQRLNVKQVQHDTLSHNIFDQLSTLHPHSFDHNPDNSSTLRSPLEQFKDHEKFYRNAPNQINKNIWRAFQLGSYNSIFQLVDLRQHLLNSMTKVMSIVERRRIARLVEPSTLTKNGSDILLIIPDDPKNGIYDMSDHESFPDFEAQQPTGGHNIPFREIARRFSAAPYELRYQASVVSEKLSLLLDAATTDSGSKKMLRIWLLSYINTISERQHGATQAIKTSIPGQSELDSISAINSLAHLFYFALDGGDAFAECSKHRESLSDILNKWTNRTLKVDGTEPASRTTLELLYSSYELTRMVTSVMKYISKQPSYLKVQKDISSDVEDAVKDLQDAVLSKSATIKKTLGESGWMDKVLDSLTQTSDDIGKDKSTSSEAFVTTLSDVVGEGFMEDWAGNVVESWKDSIGGFSYFKSA